jgi:predicted lipid-binding transport protein (Tim44 family)
MSDGFAYLDIIFFAMVAAFIALRLRSVLGRRTGNERRRQTPLDAPAKPRPADNVVPLPDRAPPPVADEPVFADIHDGTVRAGLAQIRRSDPGFDVDSFLQGARAAFSMIVEAFARADRATLRPLLAPEVFARFAGSIEERERRGETLTTELVAIREAEVVEARMLGSRARLGVRFTSEQINVTRDAGGQVVDGDPARIDEVVDIWAFERDTRSRDPNWQLVETRTPA